MRKSLKLRKSRLIISLAALVSFAFAQPYTPTLNEANIKSKSRPIQLVRPSGKDKSIIEVVPEGLEYLKSIPAPVGVVSAIGAIHTGKSFLLNQLAGISSGSYDSAIERQATAPLGFRVGYTLKPETSGIWVQGNPVVEGGTSIILVDTEGLFSTDGASRESYDAKLFAIATLLSSEVIYNTVKFIDTQQVDALETLIRRTSLFGLRAYAHQGPLPDLPTPPSGPRGQSESLFGGGGAAVRGQSGEQVQNLLTYLKTLVPQRLSWVVRDFVQDLEHVVPEQWLRELLTRAATAEGTSAVSTFFSQIDCVPLPVPARNSETLMKLDRIDQSQLNPDYRDAIDDFRRRLFARVQRNPKRKDGGALTGGPIPMSGSDIADLLKFLVDAANAQTSAATNNASSAFPEIPRMAEQFTRLQLDLMKNDILAILKRDLLAACRLAIEEKHPLTEEKFDLRSEIAQNNARELWRTTVAGLAGESDWTRSEVSSAVKVQQARREDFEAGLRATHEEVKAQNCKIVQSWCQSFVDGLKSALEQKIEVLHNTTGPLLPAHLKAQLHILREEHLAVFNQALAADGRGTSYSAHSLPAAGAAKTNTCCNATLESFGQVLNSVIERAERRNEEMVTMLLSSQSDRLIRQGRAAAADRMSVLLTQPQSKVESEILSLRDAAQRSFDESVAKFKGETIYRVKRSDLVREFQSLLDSTLEAWHAECRKNATSFMNEEDGRFRHEISRSIPVPSEDKTLVNRFNERADKFRQAFRAKVLCHAESDIGRDATAKLEKLIVELYKELEKKNADAFIQVSKNTLGNLSRSLAAEARLWVNPFTFRQEAFNRALRALRESYRHVSENPRDAENGLRSAAEQYVSKELAPYLNLIKGRLLACITAIVIPAAFLIRAIRHGRGWIGMGFVTVSAGTAVGLWHIRSTYGASALSWVANWTFGWVIYLFGLGLAATMIVKAWADQTQFEYEQFRHKRTGHGYPASSEYSRGPVILSTGYGGGSEEQMGANPKILGSAGPAYQQFEPHTGGGRSGPIRHSETGGAMYRTVTPQGQRRTNRTSLPATYTRTQY